MGESRYQRLTSFPHTETHPSHQGEAREEGGEGALREDGRKDAQEESGEAQAQGEAQQAYQLLNDEVVNGIQEHAEHHVSLLPATDG